MAKVICTNCGITIKTNDAKYNSFELCKTCFPIVEKLAMKNFMRDVPNENSDGSLKDPAVPTLPIKLGTDDLYGLLKVESLGATQIAASLRDRGWIEVFRETPRGQDYIRTDKGVQEFSGVSVPEETSLDIRKELEAVRRENEQLKDEREKMHAEREAEKEKTAVTPAPPKRPVGRPPKASASKK